MTTVVAVKKGEAVCLATDSLSLFGCRKEVDGRQVLGQGKIVQVGGNYIGTAGHASWSLILTHYFSTWETIPEWETATQVFEMVTEMHHHLREIYQLSRESPPYLPFESSAMEMIIINSHGIFEVEYSRMVRQYHQFTAIGTGELYALGAVRATYDLIESPQKLAEEGVKAAAQFDKGTELPLHYALLRVSFKGVSPFGGGGRVSLGSISLR